MFPIAHTLSPAQREPRAGIVLVVDDDALVRRSAKKVLQRVGHEVRLAATLVEAQRALAAGDIEVAVLDIGLPDGNGLDLLRKLATMAAEVGVVVLTGDGCTATLHESLARGATSFIQKPVSSFALEAQVMSALVQQRADRQRRSQQRTLWTALHHGEDEIDRLPRELLERFCDAWDLRHVETGAHVRRIGLYSEVVARTLGYGAAQARTLAQAAQVHDIGKIAIPDAILNKPGKLTSEEFALMKLHPVVGAKMLSGFEHPFLELAAEVALRHHERWNGSGYPDGLRGDECSQSARIVAVVDVYDALSQTRCYKQAWSEQEIVSYFRRASGELFEARIVEALLDVLPEIQRISSHLPDAVSA